MNDSFMTPDALKGSFMTSKRVARLGTHVVAAPAEVGEFVTAVVTGCRKRGRPAPPLPGAGPGLTELLSGYAVGWKGPTRW